MLIKYGPKILLYLSLMICASKGLSQDIHFSHLHASPLHLNPSLTGLFNADVRIIGNGKQQWKSIGADYKTASISADGQALSLGKFNFIGIGAQVLSDQAGSLDLGNTQGHLSFSMASALDRFGDHFISMGFRTSLVNQHVDLTKVKVFEEDPLFPSYSRISKTFTDVSAGLSWFYNGGNNQLAYLGAAVFHITQPNVSFTTRPLPNNTFSEFLYSRWVFHGGYETSSKSYVRFLPSFIFMKQGPHQEITLGSFVKYNRNTTPGGQTFAPALYFGAWLRWYSELDGTNGVDALIASFRMDKNKMAYTLSYDLNVSSLSRASRLQGGPEISVIFMQKYAKRKKRRTQMKCPTF